MKAISKLMLLLDKMIKSSSSSSIVHDDDDDDGKVQVQGAVAMGASYALCQGDGVALGEIILRHAFSYL
jgi:hypothetical protein